MTVRLACVLATAVLLAPSFGASSRVIDPGSSAGIAARIRAAVEAYDAEADGDGSVVVFEYVTSTTSGRGLESTVTVRRALAEPLRRGAFVFPSRLRLRLEDADVAVVAPAGRLPAEMRGRAGSAPSLGLVLVALREAVAAVVDRPRVPREATIETVGHLIEERRYEEVGIERLALRVVSGQRSIVLRGASARAAAAGAALDIESLTLQTAAGDSLAADEARIDPDGKLLIPHEYVLVRAGRTRRGTASMLAVRDFDRIDVLGPLPLGAMLDDGGAAGADALLGQLGGPRASLFPGGATLQSPPLFPMPRRD